MKSTIFMRHLMIIELLALLFTTTSCSAKNKKNETGYTPLQRSEVMLRKAVGDSIANIVLKANQVEISTDSCASIQLNADERAIVKYLIADTCNYSSDTKVFGEFIPYLCVKFKHRKKVVVVLYDFRLHKWMMKGANEKLLRMYDLKSTDILRFASIALPKDKYLNEFIKEQAK